MLKAAFQYSYINAKIRSMKSNLLRPSDYENLTIVSGYDGLAECLRITQYGKRAGQFPSSFDGLIRMYYKDLFDDYEKIIKAAPGRGKGLILHLYQKYELENLKAVLRTVGSGKRGQNMEKLLLPIGEPQSFSAEDLLRLKSPDEILSRLKGSWYYEPLKNSIYRFEEEKETFPMEMALDQWYYRRLWKIILSLGCREKKTARGLFGVFIDILNIIWIFRFKQMGHFSAEEILNYSLMYGGHLSPVLLKRLAYSSDQKDVLRNLTGTSYQKLLACLNDLEAISVPLWRYFLSLAEKNWCGFPFQIGTILDYILFKEMEVRDLVTLTEAKRLHLPQMMMSKYLIRYGWTNS